MNNIFVIIMGIVVFGLSIFSSTLSAEDSKDVNQIKICLALVYSGQMEFQSKNEMYAKNLKELDLKKGPTQFCNKVELDFSKVDNNTFTILAKLDHLLWSVDNEKNITQIK